MIRIIVILFSLLPVYANAQNNAERIAFVGLQGAIIGVFLAIVGGVAYLIYRGAIKAKMAAAPKIEYLKKTAIPKVGKLAAKSSATISNLSKTDEERIQKTKPT